MLYLFFGPDDYTKKLHLDSLVKGLALSVARYGEGDELNVQSLAGGDLFGGLKVHIIDNQLAKWNQPEQLEPIKASPNHIIFLETSLDKRLSANKKILADTNIKTKEFAMPEGPDVINWTGERVKAMGGNMSSKTIYYFLERLGVPGLDGRKAFGMEKPVSLWKIDSELQKLVIFAAGEPITEAMVGGLVPEAIDAQGFDIVNALAEKNKQKVFTLCERFFHESEGTDEKSKLIQLNSLLADQFRSILLVQSFVSHRMSEQEIADQTGWKPGRVFIVKKNAARFEPKKVMETLTKLESLDTELKTSSTPAHVIIDLILAQIV